MKEDAIVIYLRWAKNMQKCDQSHVIYLPVMDNYYLCPHKALTALFASQHYTEFDPVIKISNTCVIESQLRKRFSIVLKMLQLPTD